MKVLELFSGTHSIGVVMKKHGHKVVSLDRDIGAKSPLYDYTSETHFKEDIMTFDYKQFKVGEFDLITASPVCLWWSHLRACWINRKCKKINPNGQIVSKADIQRDIDTYGKPMVDKIIEILEYLKPKYYWIENPHSSSMKYYIEDKYPEYGVCYDDVDYCKYSNWGYKKRSRFWNNIPWFYPRTCKMDCDNIIEFEGGSKKHTCDLGGGHKKHHAGKVRKDGAPVQYVGSGQKRYERYRIPAALIEEFLKAIEK